MQIGKIIIDCRRIAALMGSRLSAAHLRISTGPIWIVLPFPPISLKGNYIVPRCQQANTLAYFRTAPLSPALETFLIMFHVSSSQPATESNESAVICLADVRATIFNLAPGRLLRVRRVARPANQPLRFVPSRNSKSTNFHLENIFPLKKKNGVPICDFKKPSVFSSLVFSSFFVVSIKARHFSPEKLV